jgi:7,8-dihydropterin-6-yl-methyl-4-(beta-D-ribofuranosyl)aminobenzene 5'-phosphate synthase
MNKNLIIIVFIFYSYYGICQITNTELYKTDSIKLAEAIRSDTTLSTILKLFGDPFILLDNYIAGCKIVQDEFELKNKSLYKINNLGETKKLKITPIVEWLTLNENFISVDGVSYLIEVDDATILFDLGAYNQEPSENARFNLIDTKDLPAPLPINLKQTGHSFPEIDYIVISHDHADHTGGNGEIVNTKTFYLDRKQFDIGNVKVYTPVKMDYPGGDIIHSVEPTKICEGVATTGVITNYDFFIGKLGEQALAINVKDHGIVLISGCGHQTVQKLIKRSNSCFDIPVYGLIGGLHLVCSNTRKLGMLSYVGSGRPPWAPVNKEVIEEYINEFDQDGIEIIGLSAHDSCDSTLVFFKRIFGERYHDIIAGKTIEIK